jgi:hypothetical protein
MPIRLSRQEPRPVFTVRLGWFLRRTTAGSAGAGTLVPVSGDPLLSEVGPSG